MAWFVGIYVLLYNKVMIEKRVCITCGGELPKWKKKYCGDGCKPIYSCMDCGKSISYGYYRCRSCASKQAWSDPETVNRRLQVLRSDANRQQVSRSVKIAWRRGDYDSAETRQKKSESVKKSWEIPSRKKVQSIKIKESWDRGDHDGQWTLGVRENQSKVLKDWCIQNPDIVRARVERMRGVRASLSNEEIYTDEVKAKMSRSVMAAWERGDYDDVFRSPTSVEIKISNVLDKEGIAHISQFSPRGYSRVYDELVYPNVLIEIHGDYWHGPNFPKTQERDKEKAQWAEENEYFLVTIWEHEITDCGAEELIIERVKPLLESIAGQVLLTSGEVNNAKGT